MPIKESIAGNGWQIVCWNITESTVELEKLCAEARIAPVNNFTLETRYQQYLVTQLLFKQLFDTGILRYNNNGKPYVEGSNREYVSISHSGQTVVMMKSLSECGVDIEGIHPRVIKVKHKFLNDDELTLVANADVDTLVRYWTAKEAMFKVYGSQDVFMRSHIFISEVRKDKARALLIDGMVTLKRDIYFRKMDDTFLAWTVINEEK